MRSIILFLPMLLFASEFSQLLQGVAKQDLIRAKGLEEKAMLERYLAAKAKNLPSLFVKLNAIRLKDTPTIYLHMPQMPVTALPMGKRTHIEAEAGLSYPIFSGFAITSLIQKAKLTFLRTSLAKKDLKRNLYLQLARLYASLYATNQKIKALQKAKEALHLAYKKAKGFYEQDLAPLSEVYNIEAKMYEIEAEIAETKAKKKQIINVLRYVSGKSAQALKLPPIKKVDTKQLLQRADIVALQKELAVARSDIALAKSNLYPKVALQASLKRFGDSLALNGDGYRNRDESYVGVGVKYSFDGATRHTIEAAKKAYLAKKSFLNDYIQKAQTELKNSLIALEALQKRLQWARKRLQASSEYRRLVQGRFANQLASADELSRAIAKEAEAKAVQEGIKAQMFAMKCEVALQIGLKTFLKALQ